jgi:hypothetical protein
MLQTTNLSEFKSINRKPQVSRYRQPNDLTRHMTRVIRQETVTWPSTVMRLRESERPLLFAFTAHYLTSYSDASSCSPSQEVPNLLWTPWFIAAFKRTQPPDLTPNQLIYSTLSHPVFYLFIVYLFICGLFNGTASSSDYTASNDRMINELKAYGKKRSWPNLRWYPRIYLEALRKTTKNLTQHNRSPVWDFNTGIPKFEARMPTPWGWRSVVLTPNFPIVHFNNNTHIYA